MAHELFAAVYDRVLAPVERSGLAERRQALLAGARGDVLEVGGGTGLNLVHYPDDGSVRSVTVLEPDAAMRTRLLRRLTSSPLDVTVHETTLEAADLAPSSFDTVVTSLVLCSVPDLPAALAQIAEVLRPDGQLLFLEHVRVPGLRGAVQRLSRPLWKRVAGGCHPDRDIVGALRLAGYSVTRCDRFTLRFTFPHITPAASGVARPRKAA